jgi:hypothetical protein
MTDPAAKETRAVPQTIHPLNFQRSIVASVGFLFVVFMSSFSAAGFYE